MNSTLFNRVSARTLTIITLLSLILSAFPAPFFVAEAADTIFEDSFESGDFSAWSGSGSKWSTVNNASGAHSGNVRAEGKGNTAGSVLSKFIDVSDYENLEYSFWYQLDGDGFESDDSLTFDYTLDGSTWFPLETFTDGDETTNWTQVTGNFPDVSSATNFGFRFNIVADTGSDVFELEDVSITGEEIEDVPDCSSTDTVELTTFDTFSLGDVDGQNDWSSTGSFDQEVVENTYGHDSFGCQSLRISNSVTSGSFGDQTFAAPVATPAGESSVATNDRYEAQFDIASTQNDQQSGLAISVSPDDGNGSRMSYLGFSDEASGIRVTFYDVTNPGPLGTGSSFNPTDLGLLSRDDSHTIKFVIEFVDGPANDIVEIYINGSLAHTGTTWEDYYRYDPEQNGNSNQLFPIDTMIFRAAGAAAPGTDGNGYLFDNLSLETSVIDDDIIYQCTSPDVLHLDVSASDESTLFSVNTTTGVGTEVQTYPDKLLDLAADENGVLYSTSRAGDNTDELVILEPNGDITTVGATGLAGTDKTVAMNFAPDGTLYALTQNNDSLYEINSSTGAATLLHTFTSLDVSGGDLVVNADNELVYVASGGTVYVIDLTTYGVSSVGSLTSKQYSSLTLKDDTYYAMGRSGDTFVAFTLDPFATSVTHTGVGPFDYGDGTSCPVVATETETSETVVVTGDTAPGYDLPGWLFNRDTNTDTPFEFNTDQFSIGDGSLYVFPIGDTNPSDKFIGELFVHQLVKDVQSISYDYRLGDSVDSGQANQFYANAYINFDGSDDYGHCVYNIVPTDGSAGWHTMTFDPTADYDVRTRGSAPSTCPDSPSELPMTAELRMFAINLGDTSDSDEGVDGYFDKVVTVIKDDSNTHTTTYDFEPEPTSTVTLCKYDTDEEPLEGWTLLLRGEHVEDVSVPADDVDGVDTVSLLSSGLSYIVEVIGTWLNDRDPDNHVDAEYSTEDDWDTYMDGFTGYGENILDLQINQSFVDWGTYSEDHSYATSFMPVSDGAANFRIFDGTGETPNASWYADNSGSLDVTLSGGYAGVTDEEGCVTFYDVPYGTYEIDEIDQDGWYYYSGKGEVTVDEDEEQFVVVNSDTEPVDVSLVITNPATDYEVLSGEHTFEAEYTDDDETVDTIHWAIKVGSCEGNNPDINMAGFGMDGYSPATYDHNTGHIEVTVDMSAWEDDDYCFVVNPQETGGQTDTDREIRWFTLVNPVMLTCEADVNLLANASFEEPDISGEADGWELVDPIGWLVEKVGSTVDTLMEIQRGNTGVITWSASDGDQMIELDGEEPSTFSQTISTIADKTYTLSWDFSARPGRGSSDNQLEVFVNDEEVASNMADGTALSDTDWSTGTYSFTGDGDDVEIVFADGSPTVNGYGGLLDNVSLICDPDTGYSDVYCGDGEVNQAWEQCEPGEEGCANYCRFENQCHADLQLMKITLDDTDSASFDGKAYIGATDKIAPNGYWFNVADFGSDSAVDVVGDVDGLALDYDGSELKLAFEGGNGSGEIDYVQGSLEFMGFADIESDDVTREINGSSYKLEPANGSGGFPDAFDVTSSSTVEFDLRADTGNDGVTLALVPTEEFGQCEDNGGGNGNEGDTTFYRIEGYLWNDEDQDDVVDEGESYLNGWTLSITNGTTTATTSSNSEGYFFFDVEEGTWTLTADSQANWTLVYPSSGSYEITVPETLVTQSTPGFFGSLLAMFTNVAHANTIVTLSGQYNFGFASTGGGGGSSSGSSGGSSTGGSGSDDDDDDGPTQQVAGAQTSIFPSGAPNAGFGAQAEPADRGLLMVFILAAAIYFGRRFKSHAE